MKKREIVISIDDNCDEPFNETDHKHWWNVVAEMLENYDIEITKVQVRDVEPDAT